MTKEQNFHLFTSQQSECFCFLRDQHETLVDYKNFSIFDHTQQDTLKDMGKRNLAKQKKN